MSESPVTDDDVFEMPHTNPLMRDPGGLTKWFIFDRHTTAQGQEVVALRSVDGRTASMSVAVKPVTYTVKNADGEETVLTAPSLDDAVNIVRGGRAAAQARFDAHHALFLKRYPHERRLEANPGIVAIDARIAAAHKVVDEARAAVILAKAKGDVAGEKAAVASVATATAAEKALHADRRKSFDAMRRADTEWMAVDAEMKAHCTKHGLALHHV